MTKSGSLHSTSDLGSGFSVSIFRSFENNLPCFLRLALLATTDDRVLASHSFGWPCADILLFNFMHYLGIVHKKQSEESKQHCKENGAEERRTEISKEKI